MIIVLYYLKVGHSRSGTSGTGKYARSCITSQKVTPIRTSGITVTGVPGGSSGKNRVYSILDKIRIANEERFSHHHSSSNHEYVVDSIKSLNGSR